MNDFDQYEDYEALFDPLHSDRKARRQRKPKAHHNPKKAQREVITEIAAESNAESSFQTTYVPGHFEEGWLLDSLRPFYDRGLITDVLARVKGGKEANVYRCAAHPETGLKLVAAKVYRPRMFRNLRNDKMYREGREVLTGDGKVIKKTDHRIMRALGKKSAFGEEVAHTSWLMYEYTSLQKLYAAGAAVPQPISSAENALLMGYCGDENMAAPALSEIALDRDEAKPLFVEALRNIEVMLQNGIIHGDLSAYNILYWEGTITLIDFPQVTNTRSNSQAYPILERDITRVCDYFANQGVGAARDSQAILRRMWKRYVELDAKIQAADLSALISEDEDD
ncbi:MAG TPA: RIO1 family regulatory kinase/ATPase [Phototrophicaceae bacterium]|nr:RIO1 family regulatory kinase/ATPase [Phototrophicaceae bacterium]